MEFLASLAIKALIGTSVCGTITVGTIYKCDRTLLGFKDDSQNLLASSKTNGGGEAETQTGTGITSNDDPSANSVTQGTVVAGVTTDNPTVNSGNSSSEGLSQVDTNSEDEVPPSKKEIKTSNNTGVATGDAQTAISGTIQETSGKQSSTIKPVESVPEQAENTGGEKLSTTHTGSEVQVGNAQVTDAAPKVVSQLKEGQTDSSELSTVIPPSK